MYDLLDKVCGISCMILRVSSKIFLFTEFYPVMAQSNQTSLSNLNFEMCTNIVHLHQGCKICMRCRCISYHAALKSFIFQLYSSVCHQMPLASIGKGRQGIKCKVKGEIAHFRFNITSLVKKI